MTVVNKQKSGRNANWRKHRCVVTNRSKIKGLVGCLLWFRDKRLESGQKQTAPRQRNLCFPGFDLWYQYRRHQDGQAEEFWPHRLDGKWLHLLVLWNEPRRRHQRPRYPGDHAVHGTRCQWRPLEGSLLRDRQENQRQDSVWSRPSEYVLVFLSNLTYSFQTSLSPSVSPFSTEPLRELRLEDTPGRFNSAPNVPRDILSLMEPRRFLSIPEPRFYLKFAQKTPYWPTRFPDSVRPVRCRCILDISIHNVFYAAFYTKFT